MENLGEVSSIVDVHVGGSWNKSIHKSDAAFLGYMGCMEVIFHASHFWDWGLAGAGLFWTLAVLLWWSYNSWSVLLWMNEEGSLSIERKVMPYDPDLLQLIEAASAEQIDVVSGQWSLIDYSPSEGTPRSRSMYWCTVAGEFRCFLLWYV